jgi:hypothetical protein
MRNVFITTIAAVAFAGAVNAADLGGSVGVEFTENAAGKYIATTTLGLGVSAGELAFGSFDIESVDGATFALDGWQLGTTIGDATVSIGDQGDLFPGAGLEIVGDDTLADPATNDSVIVDLGNAAFMVGFTDVTTDVSDVANVQASVTTALAGADVTLAVDFNNATDYVTYGTSVGYKADIATFGVVATYADSTEVFAYEATAGKGIVNVFVNGDSNDAAQNVGAGVNTTFNGLNVYAEGAYNIDAETETFGAGLALSF